MQQGHSPTKSLLLDLHFLPSTSYFSLLSSFNSVTLEKQEHYIKQSYRNRCYIMGANGVEMLIVPVTGVHGKVAVKDVKIDHNQKWLNKIKRAIQSAYGKAPFFEYYVHDFWGILDKKHLFLYDLNCELLSLCLRCLRWEISLDETVTYEKEVKSSFLDYRDDIQVKKGRQSDIILGSQEYIQVFGSEFVPNLSVIDLIFCVGPKSGEVIIRSKTF